MKKLLLGIFSAALVGSPGYLFAQDDADQQQMVQQIRQLQQPQAQNNDNQAASDQQNGLPTVPVAATGNGQGNNQQADQTLQQLRRLQDQQLRTVQGRYSSVVPAAGGGIALHAPGYKDPHFHPPFQQSQPKRNVIEKSMGGTAFDKTMQNILPMSPDQIHQLRQLFTASQYAAAAPPGSTGRPTATSLFVDLSPGATPPVINLSQGEITALVFLDSTGAPWPLDAYSIGNPDSFNVQWNKKDNVLLIQASSAFANGNLAVRLKDLGPPVMISLVINTAIDNHGGVVDYRVDLRIPGMGPNARAATVSGLPGTESPLLLNILDGVPPDGSKVLIVDDNVGQAWLYEGKMYLRTRLTLLSPGWLATMSSADGTNAYELQTTPLLLMSDHGKVAHIKLEGF